MVRPHARDIAQRLNEYTQSNYLFTIKVLMNLIYILQLQKPYTADLIANMFVESRVKLTDTKVV